MAITSLILRQIGPGEILATAESDESDPTFYWYVEGAYYASTPIGEIVISVDPGTSGRVDVFDDASAAPEGVAYPPYFTLLWQPVTDAESYEVQQYSDSTWSRVASYIDNGEGQFQHITDTLEDQTTHQFRILSIDEAGNTGTARTLSLKMVRRPDAPDATFSYDTGTGVDTVTWQ